MFVCAVWSEEHECAGKKKPESWWGYLAATDEALADVAVAKTFVYKTPLASSFGTAYRRRMFVGPIDVVTLKMISDEQLYQLAMFLGSCAMLLIVLYHYLEVNAKDSSATSSTSSQTSVKSHASTSSSKNSISTTTINRDAAG
ncbi:hypothetical protein I7I51_07396 [Histoplasma capsulatum]|uniref:Dolichyl-diphosphooligosaccharide--protein glycosyltransferase subunit 4 n=2 Tax=Histoplasma TaxID=5036 RepID=A0A8A1M1A7_AJECA|nr:hypothetical protein I7I51_07396 [Histoplasma capsulatum]